MIRGILFDLGDTVMTECPDVTISILDCDVRPLPHADEVLQELSLRFDLGIVSNTLNSNDADISELLRRAGLLKYFKAVVTSVDAGSAKPEPHIFNVALHRLGLSKSEVIMIGDRIETDILGANRLGIPSILYRWNERYSSHATGPLHEPTATVNSLLELAPLLSSQTFATGIN